MSIYEHRRWARKHHTDAPFCIACGESRDRADLNLCELCRGIYLSEEEVADARDRD
jgi:hypothetical protein